jgi:hypothetical protein
MMAFEVVEMMASLLAFWKDREMVVLRDRKIVVLTVKQMGKLMAA